MTAENGLWASAVFAVVATMIALAFAIYRAQKGIVPGQREALLAMTARINEQEVLIESLQRRMIEQWRRIDEQDKKLSEIKIENDRLKLLTDEQAAIIKALQRQLSGYGSPRQRRTSPALRETLTERMNEAELRIWAADLDIGFDDLSGKTYPEKLLAFLNFLERHGRVDEALGDLRQRRPDIPLDGA